MIKRAHYEQSFLFGEVHGAGLKEKSVKKKKRLILTRRTELWVWGAANRTSLVNLSFRAPHPQGSMQPATINFFVFSYFFLTCTTGFAEKEGMLVIYELQRTYRTNSVQEWKIPQFREYISVPWLSKLSPNSFLKWRIPCLFSSLKDQEKPLTTLELACKIASLVS